MESLKNMPLINKILASIMVVTTVLFLVITSIFSNNTQVYIASFYITLGIISICGLIVVIKAFIILANHKNK